MTTFTRYRIIKAVSLEQLESQVQEEMDCGELVPVGGVLLVPPQVAAGETMTTFVQAMVRPRTRVL